MNHSLGILLYRVKFALHLVNFMTNFELQIQGTIVRMKGSKKACPRFLNLFLLFKKLTYITFLFPLKSVLKIENP